MSQQLGRLAARSPAAAHELHVGVGPPRQVGVQPADAHGIVSCIPSLVVVGHLRRSRGGGPTMGGCRQANGRACMCSRQRRPAFCHSQGTASGHEGHVRRSDAPGKPNPCTWLAIWRSGTERSTFTPSTDRKRGMEASGPMPSMKPCRGPEKGREGGRWAGAGAFCGRGVAASAGARWPWAHPPSWVARPSTPLHTHPPGHQ